MTNANPFDALIDADDQRARTTSENPFDALIEQDDASKLRAASLATASHNPDAYARANKIAQRNGWPVAMVAADPAPFEQREALTQLDRVAKEAPKAAGWLAKPENMALARDDAEGLTLLEKALGAWHGSIFNAPMRGLERAEIGNSFAMGDTSALASLWHTITDSIDQVAQRPVREITSALKLTDDQGQNPFADPLGAQAQAAGALDVTRELEKDQQAQAQRVGPRPVFDDFLRNPNEAIAQLFAYYGNQGAASLPAIALAVAARNPELGGAIMGTTTGAQTFTSLRADGIDRRRAAGAGIQSGLIEASLGGTGLEAATRPGARALLTGPLTEAGTEALTEWGQTDAEDFARGRRTPMAERLSRLVDAAALGLGFGLGEKASSSMLDATLGEHERGKQREVVNRITGALRSADNANRVQAITEIAAGLKLGQRSPEALADFVAQVGEGNVYLAADQARTLFQSERVSADEALGELLGETGALAAAEAAGGDVVIPMSVYAARIAQLPNAAEIAKHVRLQADDYSAAQVDAGAIEEDLGRFFGGTDAAAARATPEEGDAVEGIRQDVLGQLLATNRYAPADAERQAKLYAAIFRTLGKRTGSDARALYDRYSLRVRGARPDILRQRPNLLTAETDSLLTAARAGTVPSEEEAHGFSLVRFLATTGIRFGDGMDGELRRMAENDAHRRGQIEQQVGGARPHTTAEFARLYSPLIRPDDPGALTLDGAVEAAVQDGYLPEGASINDLLDAMEDDFSGRAVHSTKGGDPTIAKRRADILELQGAIAEAFPDVAELAALSNQEIADRLFGGDSLEQGSLGGMTRSEVVAEAKRLGLPATGKTDTIANLVRIARADPRTWSRADFDVILPHLRVHQDARGTGGENVQAILRDGLSKGMVDPARGLEPGSREWSWAKQYAGHDAYVFAGVKYLPNSSGRLAPGNKPLFHVRPNKGESLFDAIQRGAVTLPPVDESQSLYQSGQKRDSVRGNEASRSAAQALEGLAAVGGRAPQSGWVAATRVRGSDGNPAVIHRGSRDGSTSLDAFEQSQLGQASGNANAVLGVWFSSWKSDAARYGQVGDYYLDLRNPKEYTAEEVPDLDDEAEFRALREELIAAGHDGIVLDYRSADGPVQFVVFNPEQVIPRGETTGEALAEATGSTDDDADFDSIQFFQSPTETIAFRTWFDDSKVVDADGQPLVVYHGTAANFEAFDPAKVGSASGDGFFGNGFYFTNSKSVAEGYGGAWGGGQPVVKAAFLTISNPLRLSESEADFDASLAQSRDALLALDLNERERALVNDPDIVTISEVLPAFGGDRLRSLITAAGFDGVHIEGAVGSMNADEWVAFHPEQIKSATANRGTFDPADPSILNQQTAGAPRGQIDIAPDRSMSITLLEGADLSTFLHESGHFFLEVLADIAADPNAPEQVRGDFDRTLQWFGIEGETDSERAELWAGMTLEQKREHHEQWARGFEAYLAEGKAPSAELAATFARFKAWMLSVYKALRALNVTLTDDVRGVFDRLLATDEEIAHAEARQELAPLVPPAEFRSLGLTEKQWGDYRAMLDAASEEARAEVFAKLHTAYKREALAWWKEERAKVRDEVEAEFETAPAVRAWRVLAGRKIEGLDQALVGLKIDRDSLLATYDKTYVQDRLKPLGVYAVKGGVSHETAAALLGFPSGDALVQALATVKEQQARLEAETDARMRERHPDPLTDGSLPELAERAVHNAARVKAVQFELDLLAKLAGQPAPTARVIRAFAQRQIAALTIKRLRPNDYLAAERRAAREATKAAARGDYAEALKFKRDQAVNAVLYAEARAAVDTVEKYVEYARRFDKPKVRARIGKAGGDLLEMIDGVLAAYSFKPQSDKGRERAATLRSWYDRMLGQGVVPQVDPKVLAQMEQARLTHYRELTVGDLSAVVELVKQLEHQAREANEVRIAGETLALEVAGEQLAGAITGGLKRRGPPPISQSLRETPLEVSRKAGRFLAATLLRLRTLAHWIDGEGNVEGAFHRLIVRPLDKAQSAYLDAMADYGQKVIALFDAHMQGVDLTAPIWIPSLDQNLTRADILAVALNTGNASNLQRLQDGRGWGDVQMMDILRHLGQRDWDFVQGVWDTLESLWPQIAAQQQRLTGVAPPKIDATPVNTPWGQYRGGYYPVMYDKDSVEWEGVFGKAEESMFDPMGMTALPPQGHTKTRVTAARIPIKLDLAGIPSHLSSVLKGLTHMETLIGIRKVLKQPEVVTALHETLGPEASKLLNDKLKHVATDQVYQFAGTLKAVATFSHGLRRHVGVMAMGYSVVTGLKQALGFSTALEVLTARYGVIKAPKVLAKGYLEMLRGRGAATQAVRALSGEMRHRLDTVDSDVRNLYQQYLAGRMAQGKGAKVGRAYDAFRFHAFAVIRYAQGYLVDIPTWIAAHEAALQQGLTGDAAVAAADDVLIASQGAGGAKDQALIEANIPGVELFTMFYSYANAYFNRQLTLGRDVGKSLEGGPAQFFAELPMLSARFAYLAVLPVLLEELISQAIGQSDGPDDDDNVAAYYALRVFAYQFYGIPILRDFMPKIAGTQKGAYRMTSAQSAIDSFARLWGDVEKTAKGDTPSARKAARDVVAATGYAFGLPLGGPWKHVDYLWRYFEGEEEPESVPEFAAAVAVGKREQH